MATAAGVRARASGDSDLLPDLLTDTDRLGELSDGSIPTGENAILDAAYRVDGTASFFDLTQYSDYELDVTGLAAGRVAAGGLECAVGSAGSGVVGYG